MASYNGHKNWNHWNVSLWINNDEGLYRIARNLVLYKQRSTPKTECAKAFIATLNEMGITKTPDGAPYSVSAVRAAMAGM